MRVTTVGAARPAYYDRNPLTKNVGNATLSQTPASSTIFSYTVPTGRKCQLGIFSLNIYRQTVATTGSVVQVSIDMTPSGGSARRLDEVHQWGNTAGDTKHAELPGGGTMMAGDLVVGNFNDLSTGGLTDWCIGFFGTEYDA